MKISIIHPSRNRPHQAAETAKNWLSNAKYLDDIEYLLSIDTDDDYNLTYRKLLTDDSIFNKLAQCRPFKCIQNINKSAIQAINHASNYATGDLIIVVSDDFNIPPFHWDEALRQHLKGNSDYLVKTDDGAQPWIITLPIMDRIYYTRFGYIYHPEYMHMFSDTEMTTVGEMLGKIITLPITFKHNHYTTGNTEKDEVNVKNDATWEQGEHLYLQRMKDSFGLQPEVIVPDYVSKIHPSHIHWLKTKGITFEYA